MKTVLHGGERTDELQVSLLILSQRTRFTVACRWQYIDESPIQVGLIFKAAERLLNIPRHVRTIRHVLTKL